MKTLPQDMAQEYLANVWILLRERIDVGHIIPEIIGQFALSSVGRSPSAARSFSFFVWMKVIFDLQRTYSQSSIPSLATQAYLIQPRILLTTIHYVLDYKLRLYPPQRQMDEGTLAQRYFIARVLHSGLRALQLRRKPNEGLSVEEVEDIKAIHKHVHSWWVEAERHRDEQFILRKCKTAILQISQGPESDSLWHRPACGSCELRDNQNSLWHALTPTIEKAFEEQLAQLRADDKPPFWALFDILWAAEVGYIQWFADKHSGKEVSGYESEVYILKRKFRNAVPEPCALTILFHSWSQDLETPGPLLIGHSLKCFHSFLRDRQAKLVDSDLAITRLSGEFQDKIESWIHQASRYRELNPDEPLLDTAYVLSCPGMHVVPEFELRTFIENRGGPDLTNIFNNPTLLDIEILQMQCPLCSSEVVVKYARMIEPLNHLSRRLRHLAEESKASRDTLAPQVLLPAHALPARNPSSHSSIESISLTSSSSPPSSGPATNIGRSKKDEAVSRITTNETVSSGKRKSSSFGKAFSLMISSSETPSKPVRASVVEVKPKCAFDRYCFSADGRVLILWKSEEERVFASSIPRQDGPESDSMWSWNTFVVPGMILGAGGGQIIAGISKIGTQQRLFIFSAPDSVPILDKILTHVGHVRSIAVSPDGNYVAVGSDGRISIYAVNDAHAEPRPIMLSNQTSPVSSQKLNFSPDSKIVVIATRRVNGQIELILQDHLNGAEIWERKDIHYGKILDNDYGLSAVFYDSKKRRVMLSAYINKPYSMVHSRTQEYVHWMTQKGKIQTAAQFPSGSQYILLTSTGDLYRLDLETLTPVLMGQKWNFKHQPQSPDEFVALAMPADNTIYAFRIDDNEMMLEVVKGNNMPVKKGFLAPDK